LATPATERESAITARAFLVRGLLAGLLAGLAAFFVAHETGEPHVEAAVALEEASAPSPQEHEDGDSSHGDEETEISRENQSTWGLLTGTVAVGLALGGIVALVAAGVAGRIRRLSLTQTTAMVSAIGFVAFGLVPFLKYPATPPAVGRSDTVGQRTASYFGFLLVSLAVAVLVTLVAVRLAPRIGPYAAAVGAAAAYLVLMVVAGDVFPTVNEIEDFPADTLWYFRRASLFILTTMWAVIGVVLVGLLRRLQAQVAAEQRRRELAEAL
jgi:hypothetical protein